MMLLIMDTFNQNADAIPKIVYHYTSLDSMLKIVATRRLWGTNIWYLNDVSERAFFIDAAKDRMPAFRAKHGLDHFAPGHCGWEDDPLSTDLIFICNFPFVASFSSLGDSLSGWGMYCPEGRGISIGFRTECLLRATCMDYLEKDTELAAPPPMFRKMRYLSSPSDHEIDDALIAALEDAKAPNAIGTDLESRFAWNIFTLASFYKHTHFSKEHEFRLLQQHVSSHEDILKFRTARSVLIPYIEFNIPATEAGASLDRWDAIAEVIIGPSPNQDLTGAAVWAFFLPHRASVKVELSTVPYRVL